MRKLAGLLGPCFLFCVLKMALFISGLFLLLLARLTSVSFPDFMLNGVPFFKNYLHTDIPVGTHQLCVKVVVASQ